MPDPSTISALLGAVAGAVPVLLWTGRLQQRVIVLEERDKERGEEVKDVRARLGLAETARAVADREAGQLRSDLTLTRQEQAHQASTLAELRLAHTEVKGDMRSLVDAVGQLRESVERSEKTMHDMLIRALKALGANHDTDTPPRGPRTHTALT